jgi:hypothetical protein
MFNGWEISTLTFDKNDFCTRFLFLLGVDVNYPVKRKKKHSRAVSFESETTKRGKATCQGTAKCFKAMRHVFL